MDFNIQNVIDNLKARQFDACYVETKEEVVPLIESLVKEGSVVANGGSVSLKQAGVMDLLASGKYNYLALKKDMTAEEREAAVLGRFTADAFFLSANAITEDGRIFQEDGSSNRVAPMIYGPKQVIMVVGVNKIVKNETEAKALIKKTAPANCRNMKGPQPCVEDGKCHNCSHPLRSCCTAVTLEFARIPGRIKVILVGEYLGLKLD